jgi:hypothetical protein
MSENNHTSTLKKKRLDNMTSIAKRNLHYQLSLNILSKILYMKD